MKANTMVLAALGVIGYMIYSNNGGSSGGYGYGGSGQLPSGQGNWQGGGGQGGQGGMAGRRPGNRRFPMR